MPTIFTKIIEGEIPCEKIYENETYVSFLDIRPISKGHTLLIPKAEVDYFFDLDDQLLSGILPIAKTIAKALKKVIQCQRVGVMVAGMEVPHAHLHLVPITSEAQLSFANARPGVPAELKALGEEIRAALT